jgi:hypothetical protein
VAPMFSAHLRQLADSIWAAQHAHPFVRGIGDGTLPLDKFAFWVRQDYRYLVDYARVFALGASRAPDLGTMTTLAELLHAAQHIASGADLTTNDAALGGHPRGFDVEVIDMAALVKLQWSQQQLQAAMNLYNDAVSNGLSPSIILIPDTDTNSNTVIKAGVII